MHQDTIRFHFQSVLFCGSAMGRDNLRALEEKVWQYPFVEHLSFLLYFTFKISARRTSFLLSVRPTCFLYFTFCSQRRNWTLNTALLLPFINPKSGISKPSTQFNIYMFVFVYEYHSCHIMIRDRCHWIQYIYLNCNMLFIVNYFNCLQLHWSNCNVPS